MDNLPPALVADLRSGFQFSYWAFRSSIGKIKLKAFDELSISTISTFPNCQSIMDDPFGRFDGMYHIDVVDLVAESNDYDTEGLLCWLPALACFGVVDPEHGDVLTFPETPWEEIVKSPLRFLDAQWGPSDVGIRVFPWLHFPFRLTGSDLQLSPYPERCSVHDVPIVEHANTRHALYEVRRNRDLDAWLKQSRDFFPWSGVPVSPTDLLSCHECFNTESTWLQQVDDSIPVLEARKNKGGFVQCPKCGWRFSPADTFSFSDGIHLRCGQKIKVLEREPEET